MPGRLSRVYVQWWLTAVALCGLVVATCLGQWLWRLDLQFYDVFSEHIGTPANPDILIVAIDDRSLGELGRWPWPRQHHAELLDRLHAAGTKAVGLDVIMSESADGDSALAEAIRRNGRVVLPVLQQEGGRRITGLQLPVPGLAQAAAGLGHIQVELDPDGLARSVYLWEGWEKPNYPQLALAMLLATGHSHIGHHLNPNQLSTGLWQRDQWLRIPFQGAPGSMATVSYTDVLHGRAAPERLRGKWVLVGVTAPGLSDSLPVPTSGFSRPMAGIEIHANVLNALLHDSAVQMASPALSAAVSALASLLLLVILIRTSPRRGLAYAIVMACGVVMASWLALRFATWWLSPAAALLACLFAYPLWSWRRLEATQSYLDEELSAVLPSTAQGDSDAGPDNFQRQIAAVRQAVAMTREAHRLLDASVAHLPVAVLAFDADGKLRIANDAAHRLLQRRRREDLVVEVRSLHWPEKLTCRAGLPLPPETPTMFETLLPSGYAVEIGLASWLPGSLLLSIVDLSEIKASQQAREDAMRVISHDFQSPLAAIISLTDADKPAEQSLPRIRSLARQALDLAEETLTLGSAEAIDASRFEPVDLVQLLYEAADLAWEIAQAAQVRIEIEHEPYEEAWVAGQRDMLLRALGNLLSNAVKYGGNGQPVRLYLAKRGAAWLLSVLDHGPGIPEAERKQLFQRFGRLPSARASDKQGFGLGLMIVKAVAERHGGRIAASFPAEGGACFVLTLPDTDAADSGSA